MPPVRLRLLTTLEGFRQVAELEKEIWAYTNAEDVVPAPIMVVSVKCGGMVIGAFDPSDRLVGFAYSLPGLRHARPMQWSHMLGVVAAHRGRGLGQTLKIEQRKRTIEKGLDLVSWTYDPMQAPNAHLNLARLGAVVEEYEENVYGESSSPLHTGTPTDRFVADWWLRRPHVERRLASGGLGAVRTPEAVDAPLANVTRACGPWLEPVREDLALTATRVMVEIPAGFTEMQATDPALALQWRMATRRIFESYFARGYRAVDFLLNPEEGRGKYLLAQGATYPLADAPTQIR